MKAKALFLDRDGVINKDLGYVYTKDRFKFIDGIFELVKKFSEKDYKIFIITNQSGIGRGFYSEDDFISIMEYVKIFFKDRFIDIAGIYYCPHHPTEAVNAFKVDCNCRKPRPGMLIKAKLDFDLDLEKSIFIGDSKCDVDAAISAEIKKIIFISSKKEKLNLRVGNGVKLFQFKDVKEAVKLFNEI